MKTLKEQIEVMQARQDGKHIERNRASGMGNNGWVEKDDTAFDWANFDYRIKQEPMEFWVKIYEKGNMLCTIKASADNCDMYNAGKFIKTIKVREVTEE